MKLFLCTLFSFVFIACGQTFQVAKAKYIFSRNEERLPIIRLVPIRPAEVSYDAGEDGCFNYFSDYFATVKEKKKKFYPQYSILTSVKFLQKQYGEKAFRLFPNGIRHITNKDSVDFIQTSWNNVDWGGGYTSLFVSDLGVDHARLCLYDIVVEKRPSDYCPVEKAVQMWESKFGSKLNGKDVYKTVFIDSKYKGVDSLNPLIKTPFWYVNAYSIDNSQLYVNQFTCEVWLE